MGRQLPWASGSLWSRLQAQTKYGKSTGALQPIDTTVEIVESGDIPFTVYVLANLSKKEEATKQQGKTRPANPFLPYEDDLYVTDISETHLCLLNKFNVVDNHFLIVTKAFESQEDWLNIKDFEALAKCLEEVDGLGFFNGGKVAGSSQPHKHLQIVPLANGQTPIDSALADSLLKQTAPSQLESLTLAQESTYEISQRFPYRHAILRWHELPSAQQMLSHYHQLLNAVGITSHRWQGRQSAPYNFLCTRQWIMLVPRKREKYAKISVNSLGFAGSLLVKDHSTLAKLKAIDPMQLLRAVGYSNSTR